MSQTLAAICGSTRPRTSRWQPTPEQRADHESAKQSAEWFWSLSPTELAKYVNQTVAIFECQVVAQAATRSEVEAQIQHLNRSRVIVETLPTPTRTRLRPL